MTKSGFDIDELERLLAAATGGPWRKGSRRNCDIDIIGKPSWPCKRFGKTGEWDVAVATELENAKEQQANATLIVAARNSLPAILTEIRELRAENAQLREALSHAQGRFLNINIALSSGGTKREAIRIADVGEDCAKNAIARAALGEPQ